METTPIQIAVARADIIISYAGFILKYFVLPMIIGGAVGWLIGRCTRRR